jgi:hypothetical protein
MGIAPFQGLNLYVSLIRRALPYATDEGLSALGNRNNQHDINSLSADADAIMGENPSANDCLPFDYKLLEKNSDIFIFFLKFFPKPVGRNYS